MAPTAWAGGAIQYFGQHPGQPPSGPALVPHVPLHNTFETLEPEGEVSEDAVEGPLRKLPRVKW